MKKCSTEVELGWLLGTSYNLNTWKTDVGGSRILEQPGLYNNSLSKQNKINLNKNKTRNKHQNKIKR